jgi:sulfite reductase alpha subunit-like flavoprotein
VTQTSERPDWDSVSAGCPVHSAQLQASARDQVDWAGLPINLDMAFSRKQRDKVYVQHLMRKRESQLSRRFQDAAPQCVCGIQSLNPDLRADAS